MIKSFADKETAKVFAGEFSKKLPREIQAGANQKLIILHLLEDIMNFRNQPGLHAEKLAGKRKNQWSIRINRQWRICFYWDSVPPEASEVEICDYH